MANRTILIDDIDGTEDGVKSYTFTDLSGVAYSIELSKENADRFAAAISEFTKVATKVSKAPVKRGVGIAMSTVRQWAKENGYDVPATGRVPKEIQEAFKNRDKK